MRLFWPERKVGRDETFKETPHISYAFLKL